ncbi:M56 family metallopeptidase [Rhodococcus sp. SJ-2]
MTVLIPVLVAGVVIVAAVGGPTLVRSASPLLMRIPRTAILVLIGSLLLWLLALVSLSLMAAWTVTGPSLLPAPFADVCQQCLDAANPFASNTVDTAIPVLLLLILPVLGLLTLIGVGVPRWVRRARSTRSASQGISGRARSTSIDGHRVLLLDDSRPIAFSLPKRSGGIVISDGLCAALEPDELAAVLSHEQAHLRQHHHLVLTLLDTVAWPLRRVPLVSAIVDVIPHYLEIAADNAARSRAGTPALASALLKLGAPAGPPPSAPGGALLGMKLRAAGPDRIGHIVAPSGVGSAVLPASVLGIQLAVFVVVAAAIHGPYLRAVVAGCGLVP